MLIKKIGAFALASITLAMVTNVHAYSFDKPMTVTIPISPPTDSRLHAASGPSRKEVTLMKLQLTPQEKEALFRGLGETQHASSKGISYPGMPRAVNIGMNGVPVLDQGRHGSCVTFAVTAALDAALGKGDYISQLCSLELGSYFENNGYIDSGWEGTDAPVILGQIRAFGVVNKAIQKAKGCGGITEYPIINGDDTGNPMPLDEFKQKSENVKNKFFPFIHLSMKQRFDPNFIPAIHMESILQQVKRSLVDGHRVLAGFATAYSPNCPTGACATYGGARESTWAITKEITPFVDVGGHEVVIIGYDDDAIATDDNGQYHRGLLILRNSWGQNAGNRGEYYMSYAYFKQFVDEAATIIA